MGGVLVNLYRIDTPKGPVCDILGVRLIRSYGSACDQAHDVADYLHETVCLTRISGAGTVSHSRFIHPGRGDGSTPLNILKIGA